MSTCISREGEYGEHTLGEGAERFTCTRCYVFDEAAVVAALTAAERLADQWDAESERACHGADHGGGCGDCNGMVYAAELRDALRIRPGAPEGDHA